MIQPKGEKLKLADINHKASLDVVYYEILDRLQDYLNAHGIKKTVNEVVSEIASPDVKDIFASFMANPITDEQFFQA